MEAHILNFPPLKLLPPSATARIRIFCQNSIIMPLRIARRTEAAHWENLPPSKGSEERNLTS